LLTNIRNNANDKWCDFELLYSKHSLSFLHKTMILRKLKPNPRLLSFIDVAHKKTSLQKEEMFRF